MQNTIDDQEVEKFSKIADEWWSETGKFMPLHKFNPIRISYIKNKILEKKHAIENIKILDVGCGGGLVCEPFARLGANIAGIDASEKNIEIAKSHAKKSNLNIDYKAISIENLYAESLDDKGALKTLNDEKKFDIVFALEIIEHVANIEEFIKHCSLMLKTSGILFCATINRTIKSLLTAKFAAEYILKWLPAGTHSWKKFLKPSEINKISNIYNLDLEDLTGFSYNLLKDEWMENKNDLDINYICVFVKK